jgi:hypothetical protein
MEPVVLTWNFTNWVTVVLMALIGMMLVSLVARGVVKMSGKSQAASDM